MRLGRHQIYTALEYEPAARKVLDALTGYSHRQSTTKTDIEFLATMLEQWAAEVKHLEGRALWAERALTVSEERVRRLSNRGFWHYLKFIMGADPCPSQQ